MRRRIMVRVYTGDIGAKPSFESVAFCSIRKLLAMVTGGGWRRA